MKVGLIGAGGWGRNLARVLHELSALGAIAELRDDTREEMAHLYPGVRLFRDHVALLRTSIEAVVIATPAATHYAIAKEALESGKHVFVEKPLALSAREAEELVELARRRERVLMVGHLLLYQPAIRWIKDFLLSGELGEIWSLHQERLKLGTVRTMENVLWSFGVHDVAVFLYLLGQSPKEVSVHGQAVLQEGIEDDVYLHLDFPGGIQAHLHVSWLWPEKRRRLTVVCERGMLTYDELTGEVILHRKHIGEGLASIDEGSHVAFQASGDPLKAELEHFLVCVRDGETPCSSGESAIPVIRILEEATVSLREGK
jgi:predicted dehydrogenase